MGVLTSCITGAFVAILGIILRSYPPKHINDSLGYKTPFAMKNKDTWYEGNRFCGTMLLFTGIAFIPLSISMRYLNSNNLNISILVLFILFILSIILTEIHLRKLFDKNGAKKKN